jgi:outer membrane receptor protein involved in Fe transport
MLVRGVGFAILISSVADNAPSAWGQIVTQSEPQELQEGQVASLAPELWPGRLASMPEQVVRARSVSGETVRADGVDREAFMDRARVRQLGDVINRLTGVYMGGPIGENKDIRLRGLDKEFTRFQFGNLTLPDAGEKREFQVNRLSPLLIDSVQVVRNPTPEHESDGIAGRVIALPRKIPERFTVDLRGGLGGVDRFDTDLHEFGFALGDHPVPDFGYLFVFDYSHIPFDKELDKTVLKNGVFNRTETEHEEKPSQVVNFYADLAGYYAMGEVHFKPLVLRLEEDKTKSKLKSEVAKPLELELEDELKIGWNVGGTVTHIHRLDEDLQVQTDVSYVRSMEDKDKVKPKFKQSGANFVLDTTEFEDEDKHDGFWSLQPKLVVAHEFITPGEFKAGLDFRWRDRQREKTKLTVKASNGVVTNGGEPKDNYQLQEELYMGFVQNEMRLTEQWTLLYGVRLERALLTAESGAGVETDTVFNDVNPSIHTRYQFNDAWAAHAAISRSVNRPKFDELAPFVREDSTKFTVGNPELQPARSWNLDLGAEMNTPAVNLGVNLFHRQVTGVIEEVNTGTQISGKDVFRVENVGDGWVRGVELDQNFDFGLLAAEGKGLSLWANQAILDSELEEASGQRRRFKQQPRLIANFGADYWFEPTGTLFTVAVKYIGELQNLDGASREIEQEAWIVDCGIRQRITDQVSIFFDVINVTDQTKDKTKTTATDFETSSERVGRTFILGFRATF